MPVPSHRRGPAQAVLPLPLWWGHGAGEYVGHAGSCGRRTSAPRSLVEQLVALVCTHGPWQGPAPPVEQEEQLDTEPGGAIVANGGVGMAAATGTTEEEEDPYAEMFQWMELGEYEGVREVEEFLPVRFQALSPRVPTPKHAGSPPSLSGVCVCMCVLL